MGATRNKFSPEFRDRAVRRVDEHRGGYPSEWEALHVLQVRLANARAFSELCVSRQQNAPAAGCRGGGTSWSPFNVPQASVRKRGRSTSST